MIRKLTRIIRLQYLKLIRAQGATSLIARSFAIGLFIEFITLPTMGLAFLMLFPLIKWFRGSFPVSLIGFTLGKLIVPFFLVLNYKVGAMLFNQQGALMMESFFTLDSIKEHGLVFLTGSALDGLGMAIVCYGLVYAGLVMYRKRKEIRRLQRQVQ
ncbi:DUF2062 domain-containing protein [Ammoniphilus sp. CFH 90114]|uniref:DUF2062 domain-containing protein n=1 Tax=Ammoniphilus sp. CFH 90114 TaxID=2493665 RepID=UPI00100EDC6C|nr:DUF2062 domain-containing protein [Ammoniphilus sp. CFH 90114]RXT02872.1 DUF2062 domain-containing protein [Ammoniphilus sp. CFH 90114]